MPRGSEADFYVTFGSNAKQFSTELPGQLKGARDAVAQIRSEINSLFTEAAGSSPSLAQGLVAELREANAQIAGFKGLISEMGAELTRVLGSLRNIGPIDIKVRYIDEQTGQAGGTPPRPRPQQRTSSAAEVPAVIVEDSPPVKQKRQAAARKNAQATEAQAVAEAAVADVMEKSAKVSTDKAAKTRAAAARKQAAQDVEARAETAAAQAKERTASTAQSAARVSAEADKRVQAAEQKVAQAKEAQARSAEEKAASVSRSSNAAVNADLATRNVQGLSLQAPGGVVTGRSRAQLEALPAHVLQDVASKFGGWKGNLSGPSSYAAYKAAPGQSLRTPMDAAIKYILEEQQKLVEATKSEAQAAKEEATASRQVAAARQKSTKAKVAAAKAEEAVAAAEQKSATEAAAVASAATQTPVDLRVAGAPIADARAEFQARAARTQEAAIRRSRARDLRSLSDEQKTQQARLQARAASAYYFPLPGQTRAESYAAEHAAIFSELPAGTSPQEAERIRRLIARPSNLGTKGPLASLVKEYQPVIDEAQKAAQAVHVPSEVERLRSGLQREVTAVEEFVGAIGAVVATTTKEVRDAQALVNKSVRTGGDETRRTRGISEVGRTSIIQGPLSDVQEYYRVNREPGIGNPNEATQYALGNKIPGGQAFAARQQEFSAAAVRQSLEEEASYRKQLDLVNRVRSNYAANPPVTADQAAEASAAEEAHIRLQSQLTEVDQRRLAAEENYVRATERLAAEIQAGPRQGQLDLRGVPPSASYVGRTMVFTSGGDVTGLRGSIGSTIGTPESTRGRTPSAGALTPEELSTLEGTVLNPNRAFYEDMTYNALRKYASTQGVGGSGSRSAITERLLAQFPEGGYTRTGPGAREIATTGEAARQQAALTGAFKFLQAQPLFDLTQSKFPVERPARPGRGATDEEKRLYESQTAAWKEARTGWGAMVRGGRGGGLSAFEQIDHELASIGATLKIGNLPESIRTNMEATLPQTLGENWREMIRGAEVRQDIRARTGGEADRYLLSPEQAAQGEAALARRSAPNDIGSAAYATFFGDIQTNARGAKQTLSPRAGVPVRGIQEYADIVRRFPDITAKGFGNSMDEIAGVPLTASGAWDKERFTPEIQARVDALQQLKDLWFGPKGKRGRRGGIADLLKTGYPQATGRLSSYEEELRQGGFYPEDPASLPLEQRTELAARQKALATVEQRFHDLMHGRDVQKRGGEVVHQRGAQELADFVRGTPFDEQAIAESQDIRKQEIKDAAEEARIAQEHKDLRVGKPVSGATGVAATTATGEKLSQLQVQRLAIEAAKRGDLTSSVQHEIAQAAGIAPTGPLPAEKQSILGTINALQDRATNLEAKFPQPALPNLRRQLAKAQLDLRQLPENAPQFANRRIQAERSSAEQTAQDLQKRVDALQQEQYSKVPELKQTHGRIAELKQRLAEPLYTITPEVVAEADRRVSAMEELHSRQQAAGTGGAVTPEITAAAAGVQIAPEMVDQATTAVDAYDQHTKDLSTIAKAREVLRKGAPKSTQSRYRNLLQGMLGQEQGGALSEELVNQAETTVRASAANISPEQVAIGRRLRDVESARAAAAAGGGGEGGSTSSLIASMARLRQAVEANTEATLKTGGRGGGKRPPGPPTPAGTTGPGEDDPNTIRNAQRERAREQQRAREARQNAQQQRAADEAASVEQQRQELYRSLPQSTQTILGRAAGAEDPFKDYAKAVRDLQAQTGIDPRRARAQIAGATGIRSLVTERTTDVEGMARLNNALSDLEIRETQAATAARRLQAALEQSGAKEEVARLQELNQLLPQFTGETQAAIARVNELSAAQRAAARGQGTFGLAEQAQLASAQTEALRRIEGEFATRTHPLTGGVAVPSTQRNEIEKQALGVTGGELNTIKQRRNAEDAVANFSGAAISEAPQFQSKLMTALFGASGFGGRAVQAAGHAAVRFFSFGLVFGITNELHKVLKASVETEAEFVRISDALNATGKSAGNLRSQLQSISSDLATPLEEVYVTASQLVGVFNDPKDVVFATRAVEELKLISRGTLNAQEGITALQSVATAFGLHGGQAFQDVVDKATALQNFTGANVENLIEGAGGFAPQAREFGFYGPTGQTLSMLFPGLIAQRTNQTGTSAAEQLSRIFASLSTPKSQNALTQLGVANPQDILQGNFENILLGIIKRRAQGRNPAAGGLSDQQLQAITNLAGPRQARAFTALIGTPEQAARTLQAVNAGNNAAGAGAQRVHELMNQLNRQLQQVSVNFTNIGAALVRSGLLSGVQEAIVLVNKVFRLTGQIVDLFSHLTNIPAFGFLTKAAVTLGTIWLLTKLIGVGMQSIAAAANRVRGQVGLGPAGAVAAEETSVQNATAARAYLGLGSAPAAAPPSYVRYPTWMESRLGINTLGEGQQYRTGFMANLRYGLQTGRPAFGVIGGVASVAGQGLSYPLRAGSSIIGGVGRAATQFTGGEENRISRGLSTAASGFDKAAASARGAGLASLQLQARMDGMAATSRAASITFGALNAVMSAGMILIPFIIQGWQDQKQAASDLNDFVTRHFPTANPDQLQPGQTETTQNQYEKFVQDQFGKTHSTGSLLKTFTESTVGHIAHIATLGLTNPFAGAQDEMAKDLRVAFYGIFDSKKAVRLAQEYWRVPQGDVDAISKLYNDQLAGTDLTAKSVAAANKAFDAKAQEIANDPTLSTSQKSDAESLLAQFKDRFDGEVQTLIDKAHGISQLNKLTDTQIDAFGTLVQQYLQFSPKIQNKYGPALYEAAVAAGDIKPGSSEAAALANLYRVRLPGPSPYVGTPLAPRPSRTYYPFGRAFPRNEIGLHTNVTDGYYEGTNNIPVNVNPQGSFGPITYQPPGYAQPGGPYGFLNRVQAQGSAPRPNTFSTQIQAEKQIIQQYNQRVIPQALAAQKAAEGTDPQKYAAATQRLLNALGVVMSLQEQVTQGVAQGAQELAALLARGGNIGGASAQYDRAIKYWRKAAAQAAPGSPERASALGSALDAAAQKAQTKAQPGIDAANLAAASTQSPTGQAAAQLSAANQTLAYMLRANANWNGKGKPFSPSDIANAQISVAQAEQSVASSAEAIAQAYGEYQIALAKDPFAKAQVQINVLKQEIAVAQAHGDQAQVYQLMAQLVAAQQAAADLMYEEAKAQYDVQIAVANAAGHTVAAAKLAVKQAQVAYNEALADNGGNKNAPAVLQARAAVITARANVRDTFLQDREDDLKFQYDMGQLTLAQYLRSLQNLLKLKNLTKQQRQQIRETIKQLQDQGDAQWNFGDIKLPTPYEVRREIAARRGRNSVYGTVGPIRSRSASSVAHDSAPNTTHTVIHEHSITETVYVSVDGHIQKTFRRTYGPSATSRMSTGYRKVGA